MRCENNSVSVLIHWSITDLSGCMKSENEDSTMVQPSLIENALRTKYTFRIRLRNARACMHSSQCNGFMCRRDICKCICPILEH